MKKKQIVSSLFTFPPCFGFYIQLLEDMRDGKKPRYDTIHSAGGRGGGKTFCFVLLTFFGLKQNSLLLSIVDLGGEAWRKYLGKIGLGANT